MGASDLPAWAEQEAAERLSSLGDRWQHVGSVAEQARRVGVILGEQEDRLVLVAAAYLHDIGYAPSLKVTGFHPLDGARYVREQGQERLARLVAHHSGARFEADERGLLEELAVFEAEDGPVMDALIYADMTTGPTGRRVTFEERISEILQRYPSENPVHRAIVRSRPVLQAAVGRTHRRLQEAGQPM